MGSIHPSATRHPKSPPRHHRYSDVSESNAQSEEENSSISLGKTSQTLPTNIDSLPKELLFEILARLPADFLFEKARFVCPKWDKIIHTQAFINSHQLRHSTYGLLLTSYLGHHPLYLTATQGKIETHELSYNNSTGILSSSNGVVLELVSSRGAFPMRLINLVTKQSFLLPSVSSTENRDIYHDLSAIAYSAASKEYKVALPYSQTQRIGLDILTVGVNESWRKVEVDHIPEDLRGVLYYHPLTTEGFLHWGRDRYVLTLDVETEILAVSQVPIPPPPPNFCFSNHYLSTGKHLSMLLSCGDFWWEVWEMKPQESREWRKVLRHRVDLTGALEYCRPRQRDENSFCEVLYEVVRPIGWVKYLEVLAFIYQGEAQIVYNLDTHEIFKLPEISNGLAHRNSLARLS